MKKTTVLSALVLGSIALTACVQPVYTKRYSSVVGVKRVRAPITNLESKPFKLEFSSFVAQNDKPNSVVSKVGDLPSRALAASIDKYFEKKEASAKNIAELLATKVKQSSNKTTPINLTTHNKTIRVTVEYPFDEDRIGLADRLLELRSKFTLCRFVGNDCVDYDKGTDNPKFSTFSELENAYEKIVGGEIEAKQTAEASIGVPTKGDQALSAKFGNELTEKITLNQMKVRLHGRLDGENAYIYQRGSFNKDLIGSQKIVATISLPRSAESQTYVGGFSPPESNNLPEFSFAAATVPASCDAIGVKIAAKGTLRWVKQGHATIIESDDVIQTFLVGNDDAISTIKLINENDLFVPIWEIKSNTGALVEFRNINGEHKPLIFVNLDEMVKFYTWIKNAKKRNLARFKNGILTISGNEASDRELRSISPIRGTLSDIYCS